MRFSDLNVSSKQVLVSVVSLVVMAAVTLVSKSIVHDVAARHQARFKVDSTTDEGTRRSSYPHAPRMSALFVLRRFFAFGGAGAS